MKTEEFTAALNAILEHSLVAEGRVLRVAIIVNPAAGGFVIKKRREAWKKALQNAAAASAANPRRTVISFSGIINDECAAAILTQGGANGAFHPAFTMERAILTQGGAIDGFFLTAKKGDAGSIIMRALESAKNSGSNQQDAPFNLIITAGGDGTHREALETLYHAFKAGEYAPLKEQFAVLRLPLGTGNDGADSPLPGNALALLYRPSKVVFGAGLQLGTATANKGPFYAFNILSVGLDAFVTHMVNKMKDLLPGDSYKLWVDIASLFYDRAFKVGTMDIRAFDRAGTVVRALTEKTLLLAVGVSGRRTYGSQKRILPDDRNVCLVRQMSLLRKVMLKGHFNDGTHIDAPECLLFNAAKIVLTGQNPVLAQTDGETVLLQPEDFPARIGMTEAVIPLLCLTTEEH